MDMYDYGYLGETSSTSSLAGSLVWTIIAVVLAVIGGIALYFTVFSKNNEKKYITKFRRYNEKVSKQNSI